ncbi:MFS transporter [Pseudomonas shirazensis]|uniref:MFS transporter n=1 Tax=Pseudomonas shirazensis TaxID=2745494 RepID=UPI003D2CE910
MNIDHSIVQLQPTDKTRTRAGKPGWILFSVGLLYISFGVCFALLEFGVPSILIHKGIDLASMGWVIALYVPFGLTFLWAPLVDRFKFPFLGHRVGWIAVAQLVSSVLLSVVAYSESAPAFLLFWLGLGVCFAVATMDLALDALAVDAIGPRYRSVSAGLKVSALAIGGFVGGGVLVGQYQALGWTATFLLTAALPLLTLVPVLFLVGAERAQPAAAVRASILQTLRRPQALLKLALLTVTTTLAISLVYFQRPILLEMGLDLGDLGWKLGTLAPIVNATAGALAAPLMLWMSPSKVFFGAIALAAVGTVGFMSYLGVEPSTDVFLWVLIQGAASTAISVVIYTLILKWASRDQAATDYAVLCGSSRLLATLVLMGVPTVMAQIGWKTFYLVCIAGLVAIAWPLRREVRSLADPHND